MNKTLICLLLLGGVATCGLGLRAQSTPDATIKAQIPLVTDAERAQYQKWVEPYQTNLGSMYTGIDGKSLPIALELTAIEGDEKMEKEKTAPLFFGNTHRYGVQISERGIVGYFSHDAMGHKGGGYPQLAAADMERIKQLTTQLPDDYKKLPPANRKLIVKVADGKTSRVRVYDRANAPQQILELLRLTNSNIRSWTPTFAPSKKWTLDARSTEGALALTPDGRSLVTASSYKSFQLWDSEILELTREVPLKESARELALRNV